MDFEINHEIEKLETTEFSEMFKPFATEPNREFVKLDIDTESAKQSFCRTFLISLTQVWQNEIAGGTEASCNRI